LVRAAGDRWQVDPPAEPEGAVAATAVIGQRELAPWSEWNAIVA